MSAPLSTSSIFIVIRSTCWNRRFVIGLKTTCYSQRIIERLKFVLEYSHAQTVIIQNPRMNRAQPPVSSYLMAQETPKAIRRQISLYNGCKLSSFLCLRPRNSSGNLSAWRSVPNLARRRRIVLSADVCGPASHNI
jgi:hypothetical protein